MTATNEGTVESRVAGYQWNEVRTTIISELRMLLYSRLAPIADRWNGAMGIDV